MEKNDTISTVNFIKNIILWLGFHSENCRVNPMRIVLQWWGKKKGVATQLKNDIQPFALSTHCHAHLLNLASVVGSEMQQLFQNHWTLFMKFLNWSSSPLNIIYIFKKSTKKSITRTKKIVATNLQR